MHRITQVYLGSQAHTLLSPYRALCELRFTLGIFSVEKIKMEKVVLSLLVLILFISTGFAQRRQEEQQGIKLLATGVASGTPDAATIRYTVSFKAQTSEGAFREANKIADSIRETILKEGAESKNLKSQQMSSHPEYKYVQQEQKLTGYRSSQIFSLELNDPTKTGKFVTAIVSSGSNHCTIDSVNTYIADKDKLAKKAREAAVANAKEKATDYASLLGTALGPVISISELRAPPTRARNNKLMRSSFATMEAVDSPLSDMAEVDLGEVSVSVSIEVRWGLMSSSSA